MPGPLTGKTIIEIGHMLAGPYCGMLLSDLGARVIKVESPEGDIGRTIGPHSVGGHNTYFASLNRGKESVTLDLASEEGRAGLARLVGMADGLFTNLRPAAIKKLGLTYDSLKQIKPTLACLALTGYGLDGPYADSPAYDYVIQAMTGVMLLTGDPDGPPVKPGFSAVDNSAGIMGALGLVAKMLEGRGGQVDVSMYDTMMSQLNYLGSNYLNSGEQTERIKDGAHPFIVPAQLFQTKDGYVVLFITHDKFWRLFADSLGEPDWLADPRLATMSGRSENRDLVVSRISERMMEKTAEEWVEQLAPLGLVVASICSLADALESSLSVSRDMVIEIPVDHDRLRLIGSAIKVDGEHPDFRPPPALGEHNARLLP
ncbi:CoA transferase [Hoeflea sp.]|jgi:crotonobetainyl-CoA:carnitine CoA-transferase CaiB-like acyl-CoA transferase|uniref:CaiB/BaiF CoA transferase family protein n=1 Tax=Hoeflea sp. TaxID=1940281 RepID=UPI0019B75DD0|nr:CoA transferase [Hoeflea sp.]MBC7284923.1 CoA transferase [Hoeflea sp.]